MNLERIFQISAAILAAIAVYFAWKGNMDGVLVAGALAGSAYFLAIRTQIKARIKEREAATPPTEPAESDDHD